MPTLSEQIIPRRKLLLMASEMVIFAGILFLGTSLPPLCSREFHLDLLSSDFWRGALSCVTIAILCQASLSYNDLYDWKVAQNRAELPNRMLHSAGYALLMLALVVFLLPALFHFPGLPDASNETWKLILLLAIAFLAIYAWRAGFHWFFYKWNFGERVLIFGTGPQAHFTANLIQENPFAGFEVIGMVSAGETGSAADGEPAAVPPGSRADSGGAGAGAGVGGNGAATARGTHERVIGRAADLAELARSHRVARVVVALEERRGTVPVTELLQCRMNGVQVEEKEVMYERIAGKIAVESLRPSYLIFGGGFAKHPVAGAIKRVIDIVSSLCGLVLASPICVLVAALIKLDSRGPVFFRQERVGQSGEIFFVIKFRTMRVDAEQHSGPVWAQANDARVTRVGKILRLTRIDEIPQMLNVLAGKMSFVGPRPERPYFVEELARDIPFYPLRHTVKPGLTGWAQVNHRYGASVEDAVEKLRYDLYYIKNMSPLFDLNIILRTVGVILFGKGAR